MKFNKKIQQGKTLLRNNFSSRHAANGSYENEISFFPADLQSGSRGGCIIEGHGYEPTNKGSIVYLNGGKDLRVALSKVEQAGGKVIMSKSRIGLNGFMAHFEDSEGNKAGLHPRK